MRPLGTGLATVGVIVLLNALGVQATGTVNTAVVALWLVGTALLIGGLAIRKLHNRDTRDRWFSAP